MNKFFSLLIISTLVAGCSYDMPPACDNEKTKKMLLQSIKNYLETISPGITKNLEITATGHETIETFENAREYSCEARVIMKNNGRIDSEIIEYSVFSDDNQKGLFYVKIYD